VIAHVVLFEPKPGLTTDERRRFLGSVRTAVLGASGLKAARIGSTVGLVQMPENRGSQTTYSYTAIFEFESSAALEAYLKHPRHDMLRKAFWENCAATMIVDAEMFEVGSEEADLLV
jgi:hypothetical protein